VANWRGARLRDHYGLTLAERDALSAAQGHRCALCGISETDAVKGRLVVDHAHGSGRIRGLLCSKCNTGLGMLHDDADILTVAVEYLREP